LQGGDAGLSFGEDTYDCCPSRISRQCELPKYAALCASGRQPDICLDPVEHGAAAAIYHHGDFRSEPGGEAEVVDAFAYRRGQRARIGDLIRIETAERSCLDGHADANFDAEPVDKGG